MIGKQQRRNGQERARGTGTNVRRSVLKTLPASDGNRRICFDLLRAGVATPMGPGQGKMAYRDIIVIGASAGGLQALVELCGTLPGDLAASVFVVVHMPADNPGMLASILERAGPLPART